ncbi:hypothetical protein DERF_015047 [Dermatophagoides farinae]|uniref:Reverse transcriptase domain-containing protein n=1 Tax=Dermatophagoides farinae TaxID=6954 RepID=A0A922HNG1_DERFA|nr:hypothetical protein DERF_015047 [Dermatophagoides farinae]
MSTVLLRAGQLFRLETTEKLLSRGCPQGAKCSPLLWNILYDNLLKLHLPTGEADFQIIF